MKEVSCIYSENEVCFLKLKGFIDNINEDSFYLKNGEDVNIIYLKNVLILDNLGNSLKLSEGDEVMVYVDINKPAPLIYPPRYNPNLIIVKKSKLSSVEVKLFDNILVLLFYKSKNLFEARILNLNESSCSIITSDFYTLKNTKMIRLDSVASFFDYKIEFTSSGVLLLKGNSSFTINIGEKIYGYNRAINVFEEAPELLNEETFYVPVSFISDLIILNYF